MSDSSDASAPGTVPYTQFVGSQDVPPPYFFPDVQVHAFIWDAQVPEIQKYCDRNFNLGDARERGFTYKPAAAWPYVMLLVLEYPNMISASTAALEAGETPYSDRGITAQAEVFLALPVVRYGHGPLGLLTRTEMEFALPFIVVSEPWSCVCGREMLGLGKMLADIKVGDGPFPKSLNVEVSMPGWTIPHAGQLQESRPFITITTGPTLPTFRHGQSPESTLATLVDNRAAEWAIQNLASVSNFADYASFGLIPTAMQTVGLKQYRDVSDPTRAVYQALVSCRSRYSNVRNLRLYSEGDVQISFNDAGSFRQMTDALFGQDANRAEPGVQPRVMAAFRFESDIDFDQMNVIHEFPIDDENGVVVRPGASNLTARWYRPIKGFFGLPELGL